MSTEAEIDKFLHSKYSSDPDKYFDVKEAWPPHLKIPNELSDVAKYSPNLDGQNSYRARLKKDKDGDIYYAYLEYDGNWHSNISQWFGKTTKFTYEAKANCLVAYNIPITPSEITEYRIYKQYTKQVDGAGNVTYEENWFDVILWEDKSNNTDTRKPGQVFLTGWRW